jgi:hypothetical protein
MIPRNSRKAIVHITTPRTNRIHAMNRLTESLIIIARAKTQKDRFNILASSPQYSSDGKRKGLE